MAKQGSSKSGGKQCVNLDFLREAMEWVFDGNIFHDLKKHGNAKWVAEPLAMLAVLWAMGVVRQRMLDWRIPRSMQMVKAVVWISGGRQLPGIDHSISNLRRTADSDDVESAALFNGASWWRTLANRSMAASGG